MQVIFKSDQFSDLISVYIVEKNESRLKFWHQSGDDTGSVIIKSIDDYQNRDISNEIKPFMRLRADISLKLKAALAEALDNEGFIPPSQQGIKKELDATKYHLEDMRDIVKLYTSASITIKEAK